MIFLLRVCSINSNTEQQDQLSSFPVVLSLWGEMMNSLAVWDTPCYMDKFCVLLSVTWPLGCGAPAGSVGSQ